MAIVDLTETDPRPVASDVYGADIYTEPPGDPDTLNNLGPLRALAGVWEGAKGSDDHPVVEGALHQEFVEHYELQPIDFQTNGPQLFYGLRYHTHILQADQLETFHDQVGYWLWEPAASAITFTLAIPRGQVLLASGPAEADATEFELTAVLGSEIYGILSNPFLDRAFKTSSYRIHVTVNDDGTWSYEEEGVMTIPGRDEPFHHIDRNTLHRVADATPNPLAGLVQGESSLGIGSLRNERGNL
ncbi:MAG TPA: heme-binding beta-barrel domain-containing protein [Acidimicrobiales bacterium]